MKMKMKMMMTMSKKLEYKLSLSMVYKLLEIYSMAWKFSGEYTTDGRLIFKDHRNKRVTYLEVMKSIIDKEVVRLSKFTALEEYQLKKALKELEKFDVNPSLLIEVNEEHLNREKLYYLYEFRKKDIFDLFDLKNMYKKKKKVKADIIWALVKVIREKEQMSSSLFSMHYTRDIVKDDYNEEN